MDDSIADGLKRWIIVFRQALAGRIDDGPK